MPFALAASFLTAAPVSCKHTSFSRPSLHCISLRSLTTRVHYVWVICSADLFSPLRGRLRGSFADTLKLHSLPTQGSLRSIPFHSVLLHSASLQSTRCPCCARLRCRSGCGLSCFLYPDLLANARPTAFNKLSHTCKKSRQPLLMRPDCEHTSHAHRGFLVVRSRIHYVPSFVLPLLTPFLLLADSLLPLEAGFVRLGRLAIRQRPSRC